MKYPLFRDAKGGLLSYLKACNMDLRDGTIKPSPRLMSSFDDIGDGISSGTPAPTIVYWAWNSVGSPWAGKYKYIRYFRAGAWASGDHDCGAQITDLCAFDNGASAARVIICYGTTDYIDSADGFSDLTASTDTKLLYAQMAGPDLYGVCDLGAYSTYMVSKCPAGSSPLTAANWSDGLPVGSPLWSINSLRALGRAPVVGKPEGLYIYNEITSRYENLLNYQEFSAHPDNGKGMFPVKNAVCYPTANGGLFRFDGYNVEDIGPHKYSIEHRDNPHTRARITAGCDIGDWVMVATAPCEMGWSQGHGLTVQELDGEVYTNHTTNCTDGNYGTGGVLTGLANGDSIFIGADVPFEAAYIRMGTLNTTTAPYFDRPQYHNGTAWTNIGPASSVAPDGTRNGGCMLAKSGYITWRNFFTAHTSMKKATVNSISKYWIKLPIASAGAGVSEGTALAEVYIIPSRPPISSAAAMAYTGPDAAGRFAHILAGRPVGDKWEWHDLYTLPVHAPITAMAYVDTDCGSAEQNVGPRLVMVSQFDNFEALMPQVYLPGSPVNENYTDGNTFGSPSVFFQPTELSTSDKERATIRTAVDDFSVYGEYVDSSDTMTFFSRWDHKRWDIAGTANTTPTKFPGPDNNEGLILETALAYEDPVVEIAGPRILAIDIDFREVPAEFDSQVQADAVTPEVE